MSSNFAYVFPAIRGVQARREYYISMCPLRLIPKIFLFNENELLPELRAQRVLNKARLPEMARYILDNRDDYVFSALTASIDAEVKFEPFAEGLGNGRVGMLHIPMSAQFIINDGQHRRAAIEIALRENPELGDETIAVVFFLDLGLDRSQQMFADLNRHAVRPSRSIGVLYDHRDQLAALTRLVVLRSPIFSDVVEMERSTLALRSRKLFTLSAIHGATEALVVNKVGQPLDDLARTAAGYWEETAKQFPEWQLVRERKMPASDVRTEFIHSHGIVLHALDRVGSQLLQRPDASWKRKIRGLKDIDWSRNNARLWEGRTLVGGRVSKSTQHVVLTTNAIKNHLGMSLDPDEERVEEAFKRGEHASA